VAGALGLIGIILMYLFSDRPLWDMLGQIAWNTNSSSILVAIPLFVMMGEILIHSRLSERLYYVLSHWLAPLPGGLLHSNIAFCAVFGAISGSSAACAATVGAVALPSFRARNYNERLVIGSLAAGGTLDILIPPSIAMIIFGVLAEESIGRLYLAGFIPGFLLAGIFMFIIAVSAKIWPGVAPARRRRRGGCGSSGYSRCFRSSCSCSSCWARSIWAWPRRPKRRPSAWWRASSSPR
jgi:tripartite ATP-independent transporter DctM subunit